MSKAAAGSNKLKLIFGFNKVQVIGNLDKGFIGVSSTDKHEDNCDIAYILFFFQEILLLKECMSPRLGEGERVKMGISVYNGTVERNNLMMKEKGEMQERFLRVDGVQWKCENFDFK